MLREKAVVAAGLLLLASGIAMFFTSAFGLGDQETARWLVGIGVGMLGGYSAGYYTGRKAFKG